MMTNRELIEGAAQACGIVIRWERSRDGNHARQQSDGYYGIWNPLDCSDAALRLAIDMQFRLDISASGCVVRKIGSDAVLAECKITPARDIYAATRRAIVIAAAHAAHDQKGGNHG